MAAPPSCRALMNRTRWLWYMPSSAARKLSPGTPNTVSALCSASCSIRMWPPVRRFASIVSSLTPGDHAFDPGLENAAGASNRFSCAVSSFSLWLMVFRRDPRFHAGDGLIGLDDGSAGLAVVSEQRRLPVGLVH